MNRAAALMAELSGGRVAPGVVRSEPRPFAPKIISFTPAKAGRLLGQDMEPQFCRKDIFLTLYFLIFTDPVMVFFT